MHPALRRFRFIAFVEGVSVLLLFFVAMPLKYLAGEPRPVLWVGWAHGFLFVAYVLAVANVAVVFRWSLLRIGMALLASLPPFGTFIFERWLRTADAPRQTPALGG